MSFRHAFVENYTDLPKRHILMEALTHMGNMSSADVNIPEAEQLALEAFELAEALDIDPDFTVVGIFTIGFHYIFVIGKNINNRRLINLNSMNQLTIFPVQYD